MRSELIGNAPAWPKSSTPRKRRAFSASETLSHARAAWVARLGSERATRAGQRRGRFHATSSRSVFSSPGDLFFALARPGPLIRDGRRGTPKSTIGKGLTAARASTRSTRSALSGSGRQWDAATRRRGREVALRCDRDWCLSARQREFPGGWSTLRPRRVARFETTAARRHGRRREQRGDEKRVFRRESVGERLVRFRFERYTHSTNHSFLARHTGRADHRRQCRQCRVSLDRPPTDRDRRARER